MKKNTRQVLGECIEAAVTAMKRWRDVVTNFEKQNSRIEKQTGIASKKAEKKGIFSPVAQKLVELGGGNKSAPACSGSKDSEGANQLANLTNSLFECESKIDTACNLINFPAPNATLITECTEAIASFKTETKKCVDLSKSSTADDACTCWTNPNYSPISEAVKNCRISEVSEVANSLKACTSAFSSCRKLEDTAVDSFANCSGDLFKLKFIQ